MDTSELAERMKGYEKVPRNSLIRRIPVIIRLDGKCFHSFTKGMHRPFDETLSSCMQETAKYLVQNIQGCKLAYAQSDEISLLLTDYETFATSAWFDYNVQKMISVSASIATVGFNKEWIERQVFYKSGSGDEKSGYFDNLKLAMFDSRVFNLSKEEVCNYFIWRQADAVRNSIQMVGQANFSHKQLNGKTCNDIQDMLILEKNINWNDTPTIYKRGFCVYKQKTTKELRADIKAKDEATMGNFNNFKYEIIERTKIIVDKEIPIFTQDRNFIEKWL